MKIYDYYSRKLLATVEPHKITRWLNNNNALLHHASKTNAFVFIKKSR